MPTIALCFPGQGSQRRGMLTAVPETESLDRLLDAAEALTDLELRAIESMAGDEELADTRVAQPLLYLADWAWGTALLDSGLEPDFVAGHSLGELAALAIAGVFSVEAGLELVVERSKLMAATAASTQGTMAAVIGLDGGAITDAIEGLEGVWVANDNAPGQVVISGTLTGVEAASAAVADAGARRVIPLKVSGPFHSPLMEPARAAFETILRGADFTDARIPVVQNAKPEPTADAETIRERLIAQITAPVRWTETVSRLRSEGSLVIVEAGPGAVLSGLAKRLDGVTAVSVDASGIEAVMQEVG